MKLRGLTDMNSLEVWFAMNDRMREAFDKFIWESDFQRVKDSGGFATPVIEQSFYEGWQACWQHLTSQPITEAQVERAAQVLIDVDYPDGDYLDRTLGDDKYIYRNIAKVALEAALSPNKGEPQ